MAANRQSPDGAAVDLALRQRYQVPSQERGPLPRGARPGLRQRADLRQPARAWPEGSVAKDAVPFGRGAGGHAVRDSPTGGSRAIRPAALTPTLADQWGH